MTSVEVPYSIACALPSLVAVDITNEVAREVSRTASQGGIAFVAGGESALVRVNERETGLFADIEALLGRLIGLDEPERERLLTLLLGGRTEQVPFADGRLCLGVWQRILLLGFSDDLVPEWSLTLVH